MNTSPYLPAASSLPPNADTSAKKVRTLSDADLGRAVKHHRRAIAALESVSFSGLPERSTTKLLDQLNSHLDRFEEELERRRTTATLAS